MALGLRQIRHFLDVARQDNTDKPREVFRRSVDDVDKGVTPDLFRVTGNTKRTGRRIHRSIGAGTQSPRSSQLDQNTFDAVFLNTGNEGFKPVIAEL